jgi:hypothetical protein
VKLTYWDRKEVELVCWKVVIHTIKHAHAADEQPLSPGVAVGLVHGYNWKYRPTYCPPFADQSNEPLQHPQWNELADLVIFIFHFVFLMGDADMSQPAAEWPLCPCGKWHMGPSFLKYLSEPMSSDEGEIFAMQWSSEVLDYN